MPSYTPFIAFNALTKNEDDIENLLGHRESVQNEFVLLSKDLERTDFSISTLSDPLDVIVDAIHDVDDRKSYESDEDTTTETLPDMLHELRKNWTALSQQDIPRDKAPLSWDSDVAQQASFISEVPLRTFDAILQHDIEHSFSFSKLQSVVDGFVLAKCIVSLSIGQDSPLFQYDKQNQSMSLKVMDMRLIATSPAAIADLLHQPIKCGTAFRRLESATSSVSDNAERFGLTGIAFAAAVSRYLVYLRSIVLNLAPNLQKAKLAEMSLQFGHLQHILESLSDLCGCSVADSGEPDLPFGAELINRLHIWVSHTLEAGSPTFFSLALYLLKQSTVPYFRMLENWLGFRRDSSSAFLTENQWREIDPYAEFFVQPLLDSYDNASNGNGGSYRIDRDIRLPFFLNQQDARRVFDCGRSFRLLSYTWPDHPLCKRVLEYQSTGSRLDFYVNNAENYLEGRNADDAEVDKHSSAAASPAGASLIAHLSSNLQEQLRIFDDQPTINTTDNIGSQMADIIRSLEADDMPSSFDIMVSRTVLEMINRHCRLLHSTTLKLFFGDLKLTFHLGLMRRFALMGDSNFVLGVRDAIFADGNNSKDGGLGAGIGLGVRLKNRTTWPPGGAELSLALRSVLMDSMEDIRQDEIYSSWYSQLDLQLSFAVRDLSDAEMEACKNPQAIEALDFLYLDYKPTYPLNVIISPAVVQKYNRVFNFLLRLTRIQTVARQVHRMAQKATGTDRREVQLFSFEVQHFITSLHGYINDVAVGLTWSQFMKRLKGLENGEENEAELFGLQGLAEYHGHVLDRILFQCLLRRKQQPIMKLITGAFVVILGFGRALQHRQLGDKGDVVPIAKLHESFRGYVTMLVKVLRSLEEKGGGKFGTGLKRDSSMDAGRQYHDRQDARADGMESFMHALLVRLDFNGFYTCLGDSK